jgi:hydrogenase nickel incorporation protein HypA/HybF
MHEITIACALFDLVAKQASLYPNDNVSGVTMSIGGLQALEPASIAKCFALLAEGTNVAGAVLRITRRPVTAFCRDCGRQHETDPQFRCGCCHGENVEGFASQGMTLEKISIRSAPEPKERCA